MECPQTSAPASRTRSSTRPSRTRACPNSEPPGSPTRPMPPVAAAIRADQAHLPSKAARPPSTKPLGAKAARPRLDPPDRVAALWQPSSGHLVPLVPFVFLARGPALIVTQRLLLFGVGTYSALTRVGLWWRNGLRMLVLGVGAAGAGFPIGRRLH